MRTGHFREAARERGLSPAAVSQHVKKLEQSLGVVVIIRGGTSCAPTPEGKRFIPYAESLLRVAERALASFREQRVCLGASSNIGIYLLPPYLKSYLTRHGESGVNLVIHRNQVIANRLESGELDIAVMEWWDNRSGFAARVWRREELVVIAPPNHPWENLPCVSPEMLKKVTLLGGEPGTGTGRVLAQYLNQHAHEIRVVMHLGSTEAVKRWVKAGLGVSLVLAGTVEQERRDGSLLVLPLEGEPPRKDLYVVWRESLYPESPAHRLVTSLFSA